jgi:RHS repeat-associated protein
MTRDGVDQREVRLGNGLVQTWERGSEGALARLVLRDPRQAERLTQAEADRRFDRLMQMPSLASELQAGTQRVRYAAGTHRWLAAQSAAEAGAQAATTAPRPAVTRYDAQGQPLALQDLTLSWDALGRLSSLSDARRGTQAHYTYSHRGERIAKQVGPQHTQYLYQDRRLSAELDARCRLQRQYLYLDKLPLAVIDTPQGQRLHDGRASVSADLSRLWQAWFGKAEQLIWLHANHLGAVELATDAAGHSLWQGQYNAHGALLASQGELVMNLRLPGQVFDAESGLHYNDHRYYDPQRGEYLSPDPLGTPDGPNAYSYVRGNPLRYIDPEGLILFAFDGTGNTDNADDLKELGNGLSNIVKFRDLYDAGNRNYVTGVGTRHRDEKYGDIAYGSGDTSSWDMGFNKTGPARIERMIQYLNDEADSEADDDKALDIDITGFSRGAAQARDFANRIVSATKDGVYKYTVKVDGKDVTHCQKLNFRFMGLFDTVLSTNRSGTSYQLGIPDVFAHVSQAVALNEYRGKSTRRLPGSALGAFPLESIMNEAASPMLPAGKTRTEMGFLGSHADVGGGFAKDNELAQVVLAWMVAQANAAGVKMKEDAESLLSGVPDSAVLHDKSDNQYCLSGTPCSEDREVRYQGSGKTKQRDMAFSAGMEHADTLKYISYYPADGKDADGFPTRDPKADFSTGKVDVKAYVAWIKAQENGYNFAGTSGK